MKLASRFGVSYRARCFSREASNHRSIDFIEFSAHSRLLFSLIRNIPGFDAVRFHIRWRFQHPWQEEIPVKGPRFVPFVADASASRVVASLHFYARILRSISRSQIIWISTAPESNVLPDLAFFTLLSVFWRRKMVLSIRDLNRWRRDAEQMRFQDRIRYQLLHFMPRLVFESEEQRAAFLSGRRNFVGSSTSLPVSFSDGLEDWHRSTPQPNSGTQKHRLKIGMLGGVDVARRDYDTVMDALGMLSERDRARVVVSVLGFTHAPESPSILGQLQRIVRIETHNPYIPTRKMMLEFEKCDVLLAPLRSDVGYGAYKGTGAIGDALIANSRVLIPSDIAIDSTATSLVIPYGSAIDLKQHILNLLRGQQRPTIDTSTLDFYRSSVALPRALQELGF